MHDILVNREEVVSGEDEDGDEMEFPDFSSLFHRFDSNNGIDAPPTVRVSARPAPHRLSLRLVEADVQQDLFSEGTSLKALRVSIGKHRYTFPVDQIRHSRHQKQCYFLLNRFRRPDLWPDSIPLESLGPGLLDNDEISRLWDEVALTPAEEFVTEALRMVVGEELERIAVVGDSSGPFRSRGRRVIARHSHSSTPIPLKRLGDGVQRLFGISLALTNCRDGILIIDEVENGIHHSIHRALWKMIFRAAEEGNVQVVAATHSWDCIAGFAEAAIDTPTNGVLYRLERTGDDLLAIRYSDEDLEVAARQRIEVR